VLLSIDKPDINNISRIAELRKNVNKNSELSKRCHRTIYALLVATFYFELQSISKKVSEDRLQCLETIQYRFLEKTIIEFLYKIYSSSLIFITSVKIFSRLEDRRDLYLLYRRFRKYIKFIVCNLDQVQTILVQSPEKSRRKISAFLQSMQ